jgi:hypothetical protein
MLLYNESVRQITVLEGKVKHATVATASYRQPDNLQFL